jgi:hypothetical protein
MYEYFQKIKTNEVSKKGETHIFNTKDSSKIIWAIGNEFPEKINFPETYFSHFKIT